MADFQPPPTWANPILIDEETKAATFNPVWLKWFIDLVGVINASGGGGGTIQHNDTGTLQGGQANQFYHLTSTEYTGTGTGVFVRKTNAALITPSLGVATATSLALAGFFRPATPAGAAQSVASLYAGTGAPSNADGSDGDFYFRSNGTVAGNTVMYHKEAGAWVAFTTT